MHDQQMDPDPSPEEIAEADDRQLGELTEEFVRANSPERCLRLLHEIAQLQRRKIKRLEAALESVVQDRDRLKAAIVEHRAQIADDRCIEDDDRLYAALQDGIKCDRRVGSKEAMLRNCAIFVANRCEEGGPWRTYRELLDENKQVRDILLEWIAKPTHSAEEEEVLLKLEELANKFREEKEAHERRTSIPA